MPRPPKRLPGQSNAEHGGPLDPNAEFLGTQSLHGGSFGGDPAAQKQIIHGIFSWFDRRRKRKS
ncbi:hypothetical protein GCM10027020_17030 [Nocardioides salsibiostraticola]